MTQNFAADESCVSSATAGTATLHRIVALDALLGFDMFWIVGRQQLALAVAGLFAEPVPAWAGYQLEHADWIGFTAWDLIRPLFLFVVGAFGPVAIVMSAVLLRWLVLYHLCRQKILLRI